MEQQFEPEVSFDDASTAIDPILETLNVNQHVRTVFSFKTNDTTTAIFFIITKTPLYIILKY